MCVYAVFIRRIKKKLFNCLAKLFFIPTLKPAFVRLCGPVHRVKKNFLCCETNFYCDTQTCFCQIFFVRLCCPYPPHKKNTFQLFCENYFLKLHSNLFLCSLFLCLYALPILRLRTALNVSAFVRSVHRERTQYIYNNLAVRIFVFTRTFLSRLQFRIGLIASNTSRGVVGLHLNLFSSSTAFCTCPIIQSSWVQNACKTTMLRKETRLLDHFKFGRSVIPFFYIFKYLGNNWSQQKIAMFPLAGFNVITSAASRNRKIRY